MFKFHTICVVCKKNINGLKSVGDNRIRTENGRGIQAIEHIANGSHGYAHLACVKNEEEDNHWYGIKSKKGG